MNIALAAQVFALSSYAYCALVFFNYENTLINVLLSVIFSLLLDQAIAKFFYKKNRFSGTPIIIALAVNILLKTDQLWLYFVIITIATLSKIVFLDPKGKHIFNPAAFGVVFSLLFLNVFSTSNLNLFNGSMEISLAFVVVGLIVSTIAKMWQVSVLWVILFFSVNMIESTYTGIYWKLLVLITLNPSFIIFTFHMITDPVTTPNKNKKEMLIFILLLAIFESLFRINETPNSPFFSLIMTQSLFVGIKYRKIVYIILPFLLLGYSIHVYRMPDSIPEVIIPEESSGELIFKDASSKINFEHKEHDLILLKKNETVRGHSFYPGISVGDVNNDGYQDFFITNSKKGFRNGLFINDGKGSFNNKAKEWGVEYTYNLNNKLDYKISSTLFDYDNDGDLDLYISNKECDSLYENVGDKFNLVNNKIKCSTTQFAYPLDYDNDGDLDLLLLSYMEVGVDENDKPNMYIVSPDSMQSATNGPKNILLENKGNNVFVENLNTQFSKDNSFSFDVAIFLDNKKEVLGIANDFGTNYYFNNNEVIDIIKKDTRNSMSISQGYFTNNENPMVYISNIYVRTYKQEGNFLYIDNENRAEEFGVKKCGWAWGSVFGDFNLDGSNDLYVTNGYISVEEYKNLGGNTYEYMIKNSFTSEQRAWLGADSSFLNTISVDAGYQKDCYYQYNREKRVFQNIATVSGIKDTWDGRAVVKIDYDNDGDLDLLITTQNDKLRFFENISNKNNWIGFNFKDKIKYIGAVFLVKQGDNEYRELYDYGKTGLMAQSDRRVHFGLINTDKVDLIIKMKNGGELLINNIEIGKYHNIEDLVNNKK